ncbi:MAG: hypothetical protein LBF44_01505, partial [Holosporaceae bacterium]|nr:hypothetical protein [Holosporaceae bacterium]
MEQSKEALSSKSSGRLLKSGFCGAITAFSFAPFNIFPIFLMTFARLFIMILKTKDTKTLLIEGFCFFFCMHVACLYWIVYPLSLNLFRHGILIPFAITLIPTYFSTFFLIPVWIMRKSINTYPREDHSNLQWYHKLSPCITQPVIFASLFCSIVFFYENFLPGFPWLLPGYIWCCHEIFLQTLSIYGIHGLSFLTMLISGFIGLSFIQYKSNDLKKSRNSVIISVILFLFILCFGYHRLANNE